ncbi:MAG: response regulator transcription factor [Phycisphaerae bacterium]|nr:response regulator transcription factor [Phycisphaerae bacterium]
MTPSDTPAPIIRVLCVDDLQDMMEALSLLIDTEPSMTCVGRRSSADGLAAAIAAIHPPPHILILDATMPGTDPLVALRDVSERCPETRTIIYTARSDEAFLARALDAGAWRCVLKSDEPTAILRAIRDVAGGSLD